ncbi:MAG TPA: CBS domain-containing protein [Anaerolineaceae bacterium]|nr:CBS domain-containing protein [Anaerolineaceae bacterium]
MTTVRNLLQIKGNAVWSVSPDTSVLDALKLMAEKEVGALLVLDGDRIEGIISERDFARSIAEAGECLVESPVGNFMTKEVFTVSPDQTIDDCMQMMTRKRIRHLPVVEEEGLIGLISIGDVVREVISTKESTIHSLENYIEGRGYGQ